MSYRWNASPWVEDVDSPTQPLTEHIHVDVVVVGAGLTGLSSALHLSRQGCRVAVLESRVAGFGASGRNAGHLTPTIGKDLPTLARLFGETRTRKLVHLAESAVTHTEHLIHDLGIACDYEPVGNVFAAVHERQFGAVDSAARAAARFGVSGTLLDQGELARRGMPRAFTRAFWESTGGLLNPVKYVRGLRRAVLDAGVAVYEHTPVEAIESGPLVLARTPLGRVSARHLVLATNAYTSVFRLRKPHITRLNVQLFRTEPLAERDLDALDWRARSGVYTAHEILESYRLTHDNRIVGGSKVLRYGFADRPLPSVDDDVSVRIVDVYRRRFPELDHVSIAEHWGGPIAFSLDFLPQIGRTGSNRNILYAVGFCGHGIAQATYAGHMMTDLLLERDGPGSALWSRRSLPMPPEPMRWLIAKGLLGLLSALDRRVDREIATSNSAIHRRVDAVSPHRSSHLDRNP